MQTRAVTIFVSVGVVFSALLSIALPWRHLSTIGLVAHSRWSILHTVPPLMTSSIKGPSYSYSAAALRRFPDVPREARDGVWMPSCEGYASMRIPSSCQSFFAREGSTGQCVTTIFWLVPDLWPAHLLVDETPVSFASSRRRQFLLGLHSPAWFSEWWWRQFWCVRSRAERYSSSIWLSQLRTSQHVYVCESAPDRSPAFASVPRFRPDVNILMRHFLLNHVVRCRDEGPFKGVHYLY